MMKHCKTLLLILLFIAAVPFGSAVAKDNANNPQPAESYLKKVAVEGITRNYTDWETAELSGKLRVPGLPLTPTMRIFMVNDELIRISLRAPLIGEAGRVEIDRDSILLVNKMKRTYCKESISDLLKSYPAGIGDIQALLLGRIVLPTHGVLSEKNAGDVDFYPVDNGGWMLIPDEKIQFPGFQYGFLTNADGTIAGWIVTPDFSDNDVSAEYTYDRGMDIDVTINKGMKTVNASLELDNATFGSQGFSPVQINSRYRRLGIKDFFRQLS